MCTECAHRPHYVIHCGLRKEGKTLGKKLVQMHPVSHTDPTTQTIFQSTAVNGWSRRSRGRSAS